MSSKEVWLPDSVAGFVPVRLIQAVNITTLALASPKTGPTSNNKKQYEAFVLELNHKVITNKLKLKKNTLPFVVELSQQEIEMLDPVKAETMRMPCNNLSDLPTTDTGLVLYHLTKRFKRKTTYTRCGNSIVSINPAARLEGHDSKVVWSTLEHYTNTPGQPIDPHMYSFAGNMYHHVCTNNQNQFVSVRGIQGSGKTDCVERIIEYLVNVSRGGKDPELGPRLCYGCSVLDIFTHVRSVKNNNSSRACQTVTLSFDDGRICKGLMTDWCISIPLLDTGGISGAWNNTEYNFHIFYYLLAGMTDQELKEMGITNRDPQNFPCLARKNIFNGNDHEEEFEEEDANNRVDYELWLDNVNLLDIGTKVIETMRVVIAVLHLNSLEFVHLDQNSLKEKNQKDTKKNKDTKDKDTNAEKDTSNVDRTPSVAVKKSTTKNDSTVKMIAHLLGLETDQLNTWLCNPASEANWSVGRAKLRRDVFANEIYQRAVSGLVCAINEKGHLSNVLNVSNAHKSSITILDPCVATNKSKSDMKLQEFRMQYMDIKLKQLRNAKLEDELESYHLEDVVNISSFWEDNIDSVKNMDAIVHLLDSTAISTAVSNDLLESLEKIALNKYYDWKHIVLESYYTHLQNKETEQLFQKTKNSILRGNNGSLTMDLRKVKNAVEHIQHLSQNCVFREVCCIQANTLFRPFVIEPSHVNQQSNELDITSPARMFRVGYANTMTCVAFYHWLYRMVPSLISDSPRCLNLDLDSMTKMFKIKAGCNLICELFKSNGKVNAKHIHIGKTQVFIKENKDLSQLVAIRNNLWVKPIVIVQSFIRMCLVRCDFAKQTQKYIKRCETLRAVNENMGMAIEDESSEKIRAELKRIAHLLEMAKQAELKKLEDVRRQNMLLEAEVAKAIAANNIILNNKKVRVEMIIEKRKCTRSAAIKIQSWVRVLLCKARFETVMSCIALLDAKNIHELKKAVHYGSQTLLRWRIGTKKLLDLLKRARHRLTSLERDEDVKMYKNNAREWV